MERWLLISELSEKTGIPESTVRRYTNNFKSYFRYDNKGRGKKFSPDAIDVLNRISSLYNDGFQAKEIEELLAKDFAFTVEDDNTSTTQPPVKSIERQFEEFRQQQEAFNHELLQELEKHQKYIKESINRRDQELTNAINEMQETRKQLSATQKKRKWWMFWKRKDV